MPKLNLPDLEAVLNVIYRKGTITAVDAENDTADVTTFGGNSGSDVPIYYHCEPDSELRSNGAIQGGAAAFSAGTEEDPEDGDQVIVMCDTDGNPLRIVGFVDGIKSCGWLEPWEYDADDRFCKHHIWYSGIDSLCDKEVPWITNWIPGDPIPRTTLTMDLVEGAISIQLINHGKGWIPGGFTGVTWSVNHDPDGPVPIVGRVVVKINEWKFDTWTPTLYDQIAIVLLSQGSTYVGLVFGGVNLLSLPWNYFYVGDGGFEEMEIDLTPYTDRAPDIGLPLIDSPLIKGEPLTAVFLGFKVENWYTHTPQEAKLVVDYINFYR